ncbi:MAG: hypothetical protein R3F54_12905 [Alphaproteobacteria bacterium]
MIKNAILLGCTTLFGLALVEVFLYLAPDYQAGEPIARVVFCTEPAHEREPSARFGEIATPASVYYRSESEADGWYLRAYNGDGFRDLLDTGGENVIVIGDSYIEGELVNNDRTIGYLLDSWNPDLAFHEFALGGWGTVDEGRAYHAVGGEIPHKLVILGYYVGNDLADNLHAKEQPKLDHAADEEGSLLFRLHVLLRAYSRAYTFFYVNGRLMALEWMGKDSLEDQYVPADAVEAGAAVTRQELQAIADEATSNGAELLIVTIPSWNEFIGIEGEQRLAAKQRETIDAVAAGGGRVHILDLKPVIEAGGYEHLYGRIDKHLTAEGYYLAAKAINQWVNGVWRHRPTDTPAMVDDKAPVRPDCAASRNLLKAFSQPAASPMAHKA